MLSLPHLAQPNAGLTFALSYGSHMVLQQAPARATVWGFAATSEPVTLSLTNTGTGTAFSIKAEPSQKFNDSAFTWRATLPPTAASDTPFNLSLAEGESLSDVLFGEVWVCSGMALAMLVLPRPSYGHIPSLAGQSNMAFLVENAFGGADLVQDANNYPNIRLFTTRKLTAGNPLRELGEDTNVGQWTRGVELPWSRSSNESISDDHKGANDDDWLYMSAVCYLFGKELHAALGVPVGLLNTNWGGTRIEDWSPAEAIADCASEAREVGAPRVATHLYNAMVSPLLNHTIKGAIWYQGESNGGEPVSYECLLPSLVRHWRAGWAAGSNTDPLFPFGVVQLAGDVATDTLALPKFRFVGQTQGNGSAGATGSLPSAALPASFLAPAYDLGDATSPFGSVHCRYKKEIGQRLALGARKLAYGESTLHAGPVLQSAALDGARVTLRFRDAGASGLALPKMNISAAHNQTQWAGDTPFEVCRRAGPSPGPRMDCSVGALIKGSDLRVANMSVKDAAAWCLGNTSCFGFTLRGATCDATNESVGQVYFKQGSAGKNADAAWTTYLRDDSDPCGPMGGFDGWTAAQPTLSGADTIVLDAGADDAPAAVRFAWRAYPCEHVGCGLYSKAENLPPPPFHAFLK